LSYTGYVRLRHIERDLEPHITGTMNSNLLVSGLVFLAQIALMLGLFLIGRRVMRSKFRLGSAGPISVDQSGVAAIPVFATFTGLSVGLPWLAIATNSLNPRLAIGAQGLEYRVTGLRTAPFDTIRSVDVITGPGTVNLCFTFTQGPFTFAANVGDEASAAQALRLLPRSIPRRAQAAALERTV